MPRKKRRAVANLFLSVDHSRKERLQRISEILHPLLLEPRELCLNKSRGFVEFLFSVQRLPLSLCEAGDWSEVVWTVEFL